MKATTRRLSSREGRLVISRVEHRIPTGGKWLRLLGAACVSACAASGDVGRAPADVASPTAPTPGVTSERYSLSGTLTLRTTSGAAALANAGVGGYVIMANGSSYGIAPVTTDANGRYQFSNIPSGVVVLYPGAPHAYQPCAEIATVSGANAVKDIELVDSAATRPGTTTNSPMLSGVVYQRTGAGKQPVAGAVIEFEYPPVIATTTTTDADGRYSLCGLPSGRGGLEVWLNGRSLGGMVVNINGNAVLDLNF